MPSDILHCKLRDLAEAYVLWDDCGIRVDDSNSPREAGWKSYFAKHSSRFLAAYDVLGHLVGVCVVFFDGRKAGVYRLAVSKEWRRLGIGRQLLDAAEKEAKSAGLHGIYALIEVDSNDSSNFFSSKGFSEVEGVRYFTKALD